MPKKQNQKLYKLEGTVLDVFPERTVKKNYGKEVRKSTVIDIKLETKKGNQVRVSFWNQTLDGVEQGDQILICPVTDNGDYNGTKQYGSVKDTEITIVEKGDGGGADGGAEEVPAAEDAEEVAAAEPADAEEDVPTAEEAEAPAKTTEKKSAVKNAVKGKGTTAKKTTTKTTVEDDRESRRDAAVESTRRDLTSAKDLAAEFGYDEPSLEELILLADRIGRTITATGR